MFTSRFCLSVAALAVISAMPVPVMAQQPAGNAPPKLEKLEEGEPPAVTIRKPDTEKKITETRSKGRVTEVKVQTGKTTYYAKPNEPAGNAIPGDGQSGTTRPVQFKVLEFDTKPKEKDPKEPVQTLAPAPPAPAAPAK